jgi:hypothetical protein
MHQPRNGAGCGRMDRRMPPYREVTEGARCPNLDSSPGRDDDRDTDPIVWNRSCELASCPVSVVPAPLRLAGVLPHNLVSKELS